MNKDKSGYYSTAVLKACSIASGINYNTLRADISFFTKEGLIEKYGRKLRLRMLRGKTARYWKIFTDFKYELSQAKHPPLYFCNLIKRRTMWYYAQQQKFAIAQKSCQDRRNRKKFLKSVKTYSTTLSATDQFYCSMKTIGRYFGKSKKTAWKYVKDMGAEGLIKVIKNTTDICSELQYKDLLIKEGFWYYGRCFIKGDRVIERLQNSYII